MCGSDDRLVLLWSRKSVSEVIGGVLILRRGFLNREADELMTSGASGLKGKIQREGNMFSLAFEKSDVSGGSRKHKSELRINAIDRLAESDGFADDNRTYWLRWWKRSLVRDDDCEVI